MNIEGRKIAMKFHSYLFFLLARDKKKIIELLILGKQSETRRFNQFSFLVTATTVFMCKAAFGARDQAWPCGVLTGRPCWKLWEWLPCRDSLWAVAFDDTQGLMPWRQILYLQPKRETLSFCGWVDWDLRELVVRKFQFNKRWENPLNVFKAPWKSGYLGLNHVEPRVCGLG